MRPRALALSLAGAATVLIGSVEIGQAVAHPGEQASAAAPAGSSGSSTSTSTAPSSAASSGAASSAPSTSQPSSGGGSGAFTGATEETPFGPMQVEAVVSNGRLTDVKALQVTDLGFRSQQISAYADPILRQEALSAQSASIDSVSGATYTSEGYMASLQSALDQAGLK